MVDRGRAGRVADSDAGDDGQTKAPPRGSFDYDFDGIADVIGRFVDAIGLGRYALGDHLGDLVRLRGAGNRKVRDPMFGLAEASSDRAIGHWCRDHAWVDDVHADTERR